MEITLANVPRSQVLSHGDRIVTRKTPSRWAELCFSNYFEFSYRTFARNFFCWNLHSESFLHLQLQTYTLRTFTRSLHLEPLLERLLTTEGKNWRKKTPCPRTDAFALAKNWFLKDRPKAPGWFAPTSPGAATGRSPASRASPHFPFPWKALHTAGALGSRNHYETSSNRGCWVLSYLWAIAFWLQNSVSNRWEFGWQVAVSLLFYSIQGLPSLSWCIAEKCLMRPSCYTTQMAIPEQNHLHQGCYGFVLSFSRLQSWENPKRFSSGKTHGKPDFCPLVNLT